MTSITDYMVDFNSMAHMNVWEGFLEHSGWNLRLDQTYEEHMAWLNEQLKPFNAHAHKLHPYGICFATTEDLMVFLLRFA